MNQQRTISTYLIITVAVAVWWMIAFKEPVASEPLSEKTEQTEDIVNDIAAISPKEPDRDAIQRALQGDIKEMLTLIQEWDLEARILEYSGTQGICRLETDNFIRSQIIGRHLLSSRDQYSDSPSEGAVVDSLNRPFDPDISYEKIFPQTYQSAEILLALAPLERIAALPEGFLDQHSSLLPEKIPEIAPHKNEELHLTGAQAAFVSAIYTNPTTIRSLDNQGIRTFALGNFSSVEDIGTIIKQIGCVAHCREKAELLDLFIKAAMIAIDNWRVACISPSCNQKRMIVNYYHRFSQISPNSLTHHLLTRMGMADDVLPRSALAKKGGWIIPMEEEEIAFYQPDQLFIITDKSKELEDYLIGRPAIRQTPAAIKGRILLIDGEVQHSASQNIVLAYYDLNKAYIDGNR